jgi:hypothetical protein
MRRYRLARLFQLGRHGHPPPRERFRGYEGLDAGCG